MVSKFCQTGFVPGFVRLQRLIQKSSSYAVLVINQSCPVVSSYLHVGEQWKYGISFLKEFIITKSTKFCLKGSLILFLASMTERLKPAFQTVFVGRWGSHSFGKDRQRPNGSNWKTNKDRQRPLKTGLLRVAETSSIPATLKSPQQKQEKTLNYPERPSAIVKDWQRLSKPSDP